MITHMSTLNVGEEAQSKQAQDWHSERVVILVEILVKRYFNPGFLNPKLFQSKLIQIFLGGNPDYFSP